MRSIQVTFGLPDRESERAFLSAYMVPAWERFRAHEAFDRGWFWRFGAASRHGPIELEGGTTVEDGGVILVLNGDPTPRPLVDAERPRWAELEAEGAIQGWDVQTFHPEYENARAKAIEKFGEVGGDRTYRLRPIAARATLDLVDEFDRDLPAVGTASAENPIPVGFWAVIHYLMKQGGYDWYDEIDACAEAIGNRLRSLARFHGEDAAREARDAVIDELEGVEFGTDTG